MNRVVVVFVAVVAAAVVFTGGALVGTRLPNQTSHVTGAAVEAAMRDELDARGMRLDYFNVNTITGDRAYVTLRVPGLMPSAMQYAVTMRHGWYVGSVEPVG